MNNKKQKRTSLKDLAKELNVSIATVSRALRSSSEIGEEMQRRVKDLASEDYWSGGAQSGNALLRCCAGRYRRRGP